MPQEAHMVETLRHAAQLTQDDRRIIAAKGAALVQSIRDGDEPGLMEVFLAEYGLSTDEGVALMCLAEALLRVPDDATIDALIADKIAPSDWGAHLGQSASSLVNASTWGLMLTGRVLDDRGGVAITLRRMVKRLGEPVIRTAVARAMREMGQQFVLGQDIKAAMKRAQKREAQGYTCSYDMLGEAAMTQADADTYFRAYRDAIQAIAAAAKHGDMRDNPGISIKLSALHPRYEETQRTRVLAELPARVLELAQAAKAAGIGLNIDAEEQDRLALSLDVIAAVLPDQSLAGWDGFGVVVQAYGPRAGHVIDWLYALAEAQDRRIMVRLVKGAYWDTEVKLAQAEGLDHFPVFTAKTATDISYIANARKLLAMTDRIYPQFATHNAHTVAAILHLAADPALYEFQRLHGMGEALHDRVLQANGTRCRIYAPVGTHRDLLAYLVRRLLENGANSSFVNQIVDEDVPADVVAADPFEAHAPLDLTKGPDLFQPERVNSKGFSLMDRAMFKTLDAARTAHRTTPLPPVSDADEQQLNAAVSRAAPWHATNRAQVLNKAADLYEDHYGEIFALLTKEAKKTPLDAIAELREAVDFLRYYAANIPQEAPLGTFACISPWNFPLAIFSGQIAAALACGNAVIAKPAPQTPRIAQLAVSLMHRAGVPDDALQLVIGGGTVGAALTRHAGIDGVCFTGSTATAQSINRAMANHMTPGAPLIAETGGLNAMIVDSTALPEQAIRDIVQSAFQSAGQRCSALRCLYVQEDVYDRFLTMLKGAMDALVVGDPWDAATDVGPVIDRDAQSSIQAYINAAGNDGKILHQTPAPLEDTFVAPTLIEVAGIAEMTREIFGPVLHIAKFKSRELNRVVDAINATGYGLTFGLHTRIDTRVQEVSDRIKAGNIYVNRNQIGAIVGSQPFGGHGLSGTGPKAGGPHYLSRFHYRAPVRFDAQWDSPMHADELAAAITSAAAKPAHPMSRSFGLPGPTGESNQISLAPKAPLLCLGPSAEVTTRQVNAVAALGGTAVAATGTIAPATLSALTGISGVIFWGDAAQARSYAKALAARDGAIIPLITTAPDLMRVMWETHICVDTTASGGNAALLAEVGQAAIAAE
ncbi:L-glutamate gamma-semialdehyde dehydrogenase [Nereida sp. MMG024]|nr:L-glutamate gamma-semialdehyde dehydrogenase [Nereida sp. MMG025]MCF6445090.1 L-glutamate gamma-semialdehyde dehydrogenase [Nereida sp. MMG025]